MDNSDILSEICAGLRLRSQLYFETEFRGNFSVEVPREQRRIRFHLVQQGEIWVRVPGADPVRLGEGDLAIVPNGVQQVLSRGPDTAPVQLSALIEAGALKGGVLAHGQGDGRARLLCGFCQFDEAIDHPVVAGLPPLLLVRAADLGAEPWAMAAIRLLSLEGDLKAQGMSGILSRLLEIVFIQTVRRMTAASGEAGGFMAAFADARLSRALQAMHADPQTAWTIKDLA